MVFSSLTFLYFYLPAVLLVYFFSPAKMKNMVILISGLFFYAWGEPIYVLVMLLSTAIDYTAGRLIHKYDGSPKKRTVFLLVSLVMNLGLLGVFKYSGFVVNTINGIFGLSIPDPGLPLPIGISFYTFQSMSYTIDLYMRKIKVQKSFISFASYVSLFPQIVAGPIVRYEDVAAEIDHRTVNVSKASEGIARFMKGLSKKVLLANTIGLVWNAVGAKEISSLSSLTAWVGILAFSFQIYFDFSGYSDMAVGLGKMMGFNFPENFDHPYISRSISEFWRRWHITMGSWFKSYVYIPLGGNRGTLKRTIFNLAVTWFLTGLWHGASWNFVIWGLYFGFLIIIERLGWGKVLERLPKAVSTVYTLLLVVFGWVLFKLPTLADAGAYLGAMFGANGVGIDSFGAYLLGSNALLFILCAIGSTNAVGGGLKWLKEHKQRAAAVIHWSMPALQVVGLLVCTAYLVNTTYNPFLYFNF